MTFTKLTVEILRAIRGKRSQTYLNRKLGFSFNQISRWETGRTGMPWSEFARFCKVCRVDLDAKMRAIFSVEYAGADAGAWVRHITGSTPLSEIGAALGVSRFSLSRWRNGRTMPSLCDMIHLISQCSTHLPIFLEAIVSDTSVLPSYAQEFAKRDMELALTYQFPFVGAALCALSLPEYRKLPRHKTGFLAQKIGISHEDEKSFLDAAQKVGFLKLTKGKYHCEEPQTDTRVSFAGNMAIRTYWLRRCVETAEAIKVPPRQSPMGHNVFSVSQQAYERIVQKYYAFFQEVSAIIETDQSDAQRLALLCVQLIDFEEMKR